METNDTTDQWYRFPVTGPDYAGADYFVILDGDGTTVCNPSPMGQDAARVIAAAPDLLAALQRLTHPMADDDDLENALEVIARATGAP